MRRRCFASVLWVTRLLALMGLVAVVMTGPAQAAPATTESELSATAVAAVLDEKVRIPGTAWAVDPRTDQVVVQVDRTVDDVELAQLTSTVRPFTKQVRIVPVDGKISLLIQGGDGIIGGGARCSLGFNVRRPSGRQFFITAGHCTNIAARWFDTRGRFLGPRIASRFPGHDRGLVRHDNGLPHPRTVAKCTVSWDVPIQRSAMPTIGQWVDRSGSTTCGVVGQVTRLNVTVNYPQGQVRGLIQANVCAKPGDSGGPLFNRPVAFGLTSGGVLTNRPCNADNPSGITFYEPVVRAERAFNVKV